MTRGRGGGPVDQAFVPTRSAAQPRFELTGLFFTHHGVTRTALPSFADQRLPDALRLPRCCARGYFTALVVNWHLRSLPTASNKGIFLAGRLPGPERSPQRARKIRTIDDVFGTRRSPCCANAPIGLSAGFPVQYTSGVEGRPLRARFETPRYRPLHVETGRGRPRRCPTRWPSQLTDCKYAAF